MGMIPQDANLEKAVRQQKIVSVVSPDTNASRAFEVLAKNLVNEEQSQFVMKRGFSQFFSTMIYKRTYSF